MTKKEYLSQGILLDRHIKERLKDLEWAKKTAADISAVRLGERVSGSKVTNAPYTGKVDTNVDAEAQLNAELDRLFSLRLQITEALNSVHDIDQYRVLKDHYIYGHDWNIIAKDLGIAESTVYKKHSDGIKAFVMPNDPIKV